MSEMREQRAEPASVTGISDEVALLAAIRRGEKAAAEGRVVPVEDVRERLAQWLAK